MELSIVRQSVVIKCKIKKSKFLGNYEFFYGAGLFSRLSGISLPGDLEPKELKERICESVKEYSPKNEEEAYLIKSLQEMSLNEEADDEMKALFRMGENEERPWQL